MTTSTALSYRSSRFFSCPGTLLVPRRFDLQLDQFGDEILFAGADDVDDPVDFFVAQVGALAAQQGAGAGPEEQHVAVAQQAFGAHFIQHDAAVGAAGDLEGDPGRQVGLDQAGDDVDGRFLRGEDQVDADGATLLRQANNVLFDFLAGRHHQVGHFVGDDHDEGQVSRDRCLFLFVVGVESLDQFFFAQLVVDADVSHAGLGPAGRSVLPSCRPPRPGSLRPFACR